MQSNDGARPTIAALSALGLADAVYIRKEGSMVYITDRARAQLKAATDQIVDESERRLRLGPTADGTLGVYPDRPQEDDQVVEHGGVTVLLIGQDVARALAGSMIDFEERESGSHFTLKEEQS